MTLNDIDKFSLKRLISDLKSVKGEGTTLVTISIKAGSDCASTMIKVRDEIGTASNIKSAQTSKDVVDALQSTAGL